MGFARSMVVKWLFQIVPWLLNGCSIVVPQLFIATESHGTTIYRTEGPLELFNL